MQATDLTLTQRARADPPPVVARLDLIHRLLEDPPPGSKESHTKATNDSHQDKTLLAEALTHSSVLSSQSITESCERLAFVGDAAIRAVAGEVLKSQACFATAATVRKESFSPTSFAVPHELPWPQDQDPEDTSCCSVKEMESRLMGCCNHVAYARSCVRHNLHVFLRHESDKLKQSISDFELAARSNNATWEQLVQIGAPKALGDVFLACIGAVIIDDQLDKVRPVIKQHVEDCCAFFFPDPPQSVEHLKVSELDEKLILQATSQVTTTCMQKTLFAPKPPPPDVDQGIGLELQQDAYKVLTDLHIVKVDGVLACSSSPRTALLSAQCTCDPFVASNIDLEGPEVQSETPESKEGAVYCEDCEMWLNGPTQWEDHKIGKKHKKNLARTGPNKNKNKAKAKPMAKSPPGPPEHQEDEEDESDVADDGEDDEIKQVNHQEDNLYYPLMTPPPPIGYEGGAWMPADPWMNIGGAWMPGAPWGPQW